MKTLKYLWHSTVRKGPWEQCLVNSWNWTKLLGVRLYSVTKLPKHLHTRRTRLREKRREPFALSTSFNAPL